MMFLRSVSGSGGSGDALNGPSSALLKVEGSASIPSTGLVTALGLLLPVIAASRSTSTLGEAAASIAAVATSDVAAAAVGDDDDDDDDGSSPTAAEAAEIFSSSSASAGV